MTFELTLTLGGCLLLAGVLVLILVATDAVSEEE